MNFKSLFCSTLRARKKKVSFLWKKGLASVICLRTFCGLLRWSGASRFALKLFFINHLNVNLKIITFFEIKDLMGCMFHAFSVIHSARSTGQVERSLRSRKSVLKNFFNKSEKSHWRVKLFQQFSRLPLREERSSLKVYFIRLSVLPSISYS